MSYLEAVAPYDSEVAAQWAETLSGEKRTSAMMRIRDALKAKDQPAAAEFAKLHGIEEK